MLYVDKSMVMTPVLVLLAILEALQTVDLSVPVTKLVCVGISVTMPDVAVNHNVIFTRPSGYIGDPFLDALLFQM